MIFAKVSPPQSLTVQVTAKDLVTITAEYITAIAQPYPLGADFVKFKVLYCDISFNEDNYPVDYEDLAFERITLTSDQLKSWGSDDTVILRELARQLEMSIIRFVGAPDIKHRKD
jgi:hypothetical protein